MVQRVPVPPRGSVPVSLLTRAALLALLAACATTADAPPPPNDSTAGAYLRGRVAANQNAYGEAADGFLQAAHRNPASIVRARAFAYALADGRVTEAVRFARRGVPGGSAESGGGASGHAGADTGNSGLAGFEAQDLPRLTLAVDALRDGDAAMARTLLDGPFASGLGGSAAAILGGWAAYATGGAEAGIAHLANLPDQERNAYTTLHQAIMYDLNGQAPEATAGYAVAARLQPTALATRGLAGLKERLGERANALTVYRAMTRGEGELQRAGRMGLARLGEPLEGESEAFVRLAADGPTRLVTTPQEGAALALTNIASSLFDGAAEQQRRLAEQGYRGFEPSYDLPLAFSQLALHLDPSSDLARFVVAEIAEATGHPQRVLDTLAPIRPEAMLYDYAVLTRAQALADLDRRDDAVLLLREYEEADRLSLALASGLGALHAQDGAWDEAADAAGRALAIAQSRLREEDDERALWPFYFTRGAYRSEGGDWPGAEADLREALRLAPDEAVILNHLGYSLVERGESVGEAFGMIEEALSQMPESGSITDSLGWAYYQQGNYRTAARLLEEAVMLEPGSATITDHLGDAYYQLGRRNEARYEWRRALELDDVTDEEAGRIRGKLDGEAPARGAQDTEA